MLAFSEVGIAVTYLALEYLTSDNHQSMLVLPMSGSHGAQKNTYLEPLQGVR